MKKIRTWILMLAFSLFVSVYTAVPGYAAGEMQGVSLELVQEGSGYEIVVPGFKEVKDVSFLGMDGERQTEKVIFMGAPEPDNEGHYPIMQVTTTHGEIYFFEAHFGTYKDGELSHFEGEFKNGELMFNPALVIANSMTEFAKDKVFNLDFTFLDKDKNAVFSVADINIMFVDKQEIPARALPSTAKVMVDGKEVAFEAYNINDNNYFKLRDLAKVLGDSPKQFGIGWDDVNHAISLEKNSAYEADGSELVISGKLSAQTALPSAAKIYLNGEEIKLSSYNIADYNYFKLRDLAKAIDFNVTWDDEHNTVGIDPKSGYVEPEV